MDALAQALLDDLDERLTAVVEASADAVDDVDREFAFSALGAALLLMPYEDVLDLAFASVLRLVDLEVANRE